MDNTSQTPNAGTTSGGSSRRRASNAHASSNSIQPNSTLPQDNRSAQPVPIHAPLRRFSQTPARRPPQPTNRVTAPPPQPRARNPLEDELDAEEWDALNTDSAQAATARHILEVDLRAETAARERRRSLNPIMNLIGGFDLDSPPRTARGSNSRAHTSARGGINAGRNSPATPANPFRSNNPANPLPPLNPLRPAGASSDSTVSDNQSNKKSKPNTPSKSTSKSKGKGKGTPGTGHRTKPKGSRAVLDDSIDRVPAHVGKPDMSKLTIRFRTEIPDPENPDEWIEGPVCISEFRPQLEGLERIDWDDRKLVTALNAWREQVFRRNFGETRKTREYWTENEKSAVLGMAKAQLEERNAIDFNLLANQYNGRYHMNNALQLQHELRVAEGRGHKIAYLKADRIAPWRTASALKGQKANWPELAKLMSDAKARVQQRSLDGSLRHDPEEVPEIPDPDPFVSPQKANPSSATTKRKSGVGSASKDTPSKRPKHAALPKVNNETGLELTQDDVEIDKAVEESLKEARDKRIGQVKIYTSGRLSIHADITGDVASPPADPLIEQAAAGFAPPRDTFGGGFDDEDMAVDNEYTGDMEDREIEEGDATMEN